MYVIPQLTFPCSGYIQEVELLVLVGNTSLQPIRVPTDIHLWRIQNANNQSFRLQQTANFTMIFSLSLKTVFDSQFLLLSANISEGEQAHFESGDVLGFTIPANIPIRVPTVFASEGGIGTHLLTESPTNCTSTRKADHEPVIAIRVGEFDECSYILHECNSS